MKKAKFVGFVCAVLIAYAAAGVIAWVQAYRRAQTAAELLAELRTIDPKVSTYSDIENLRQRFSGAVSSESKGCTNSACVVSFRIDNRFLHILRLSRLTIFQANISGAGGHLSRINIFLVAASGSRPALDAAASASESAYTQGSDDVPFQLNSTMEKMRANQGRHFCASDLAPQNRSVDWLLN